METKLEEVSDQELAISMKEFADIVGPTPPPAPSNRRIEAIMERAKAQAMMKDSADFVAEGASKAFLGLLDTMVCLGDSEKRPKRSY